MNTSPARDLRRTIAGVCLIAAPLLMFAGDALRFGAEMTYTWLVLMKMSFALFVPAALALAGMLRQRADRTGLLGGGLTIVGCLAGVSIVTAAAFEWTFEAAALEGATMRAVEGALRHSGLGFYVLLFPLPGLAFPTGLLVLSFGLWRAKAAAAPVAALLALGALLFPVGRIGGHPSAVLASGLLLTAALGLIASRVFKRSAPEQSQRAELQSVV